LVFSPAATSLQERLIVINWWLNLTKEEQDAIWNKLNKYFYAPNVSAELLNQYDPKKPNAIGVADTLDLQKTRVKESHSDAIVNKKTKPKCHGDPPATNAQLSDCAIQESEMHVQKGLLKSFNQTHCTAKNEHQITARFEPMYSTVSTAFTPS
jgi:hypothetical protein